MHLLPNLCYSFTMIFETVIFVMTIVISVHLAKITFVGILYDDIFKHVHNDI